MLKLVNDIASYAALMFIFALISEQRLSRMPDLKERVMRRYLYAWGAAAVGIALMFISIGANPLHLLIAAVVSGLASWAVAQWVEKRPK